MPTYLLIGASRGIGGAAAQHFGSRGAEILGVSRPWRRSGGCGASVAQSSNQLGPGG